MPDIEVFLMDDDHPPQWFLGVDLTHALHGAYTHALCVFGEAVQPVGWNRCKPWANYDYATELVKIGFPYIPRPICFKEDVYHFPADFFHKLQQQNGDLFTAPEYAPLHAANKAGKFPAPEYAHGHKFNIAALTQQLSLVAVAQSVESVSPGFGNDFVASVWEWPGEPNPVNDLGPPEWPTVPQQHTPPFLWEDHWHEVHARDLELSNNQDVNIGGGLEINSEHIIRPLPVVTN
ncbi:hypothetical protein RhiTH_010492 [Rhizoctonia solani]